MGSDAVDGLIIKLMHLNAGMHRIIVDCVTSNSCTESAREYVRREEALRQERETKEAKR
jgi:hypothetical protein